MLLTRTTILLLLLMLVDNKIYIYHTEDGIAVEFYDCIYVQSLLYCRRPKQPINLLRENDTASCENNGGIVHSFANMLFSKLNTSIILHQWKSGLAKAEEYSRYLENSAEWDGYICECNDSQSFGKNCEYRLPQGTTIDETFEWQLDVKRKNESEASIYGEIICYETYKCNSGLLCLDWREICDGIQNCMYGLDEKNCDILELNRCTNDEYRCMNGMCIPEEYFLDGDFDCLDWSDEIQFKSDHTCTLEAVNTYCDDRICRSKEWSCGDGQCIPDRLGFQQTTSKLECKSRRDQYFHCESHGVNIQWTLPNGQCSRKKGYIETSIVNETELDRCQFLVRCAQSLGGASNCPCERAYSCIEPLNQNCSLKSIMYPSGPIMAPYIFFFYNHTRNWTNSWQDWMLINGTVLCQGFPTSITRAIPFNHEWNVHRIIEDVFCRSSSETVSPVGMHSVTQCHHLNESINLCHDSNPCISFSRIKDGFNYCLNGTDEKLSVDINVICSGLQRHRFRCSIHQPTCLSIMALGDQIKHCQNNFDEFWLGTDRRLSEVRCNDQQKDDCAALRQYIEQSWIRTGLEQISNDVAIPFRFYCNTFWNMQSHEDENLDDCERWWKCPEDQWQCHRGQCIDREWIVDHEWDCADASDEEHLFYNRTTSLQQLHERNNFTNNADSHLGVCNQTHPFPCFTVQPSHRKFSCIRLDQIGNKEIDCLGAIDERNLLKHCNESKMLGNYFHCQSNNQCISHWRHCDTHRCSNSTDDNQWCSLRRKTPNCSLTNDFVCFDGTCAKRGRCDTVFNCAFDEDEYMCDYPSASSWNFISYRQRKESSTRVRNNILHLPVYPRNAIINKSNLSDDKVEQRNNSWCSDRLFESAFVCHRGIGIFLSNCSIVCLCPPHYHGEKCQYHTDRLIVLLHLNFSRSIYSDIVDQEMVLKCLVLFFYQDQTLMAEEFHLRPAQTSDTIRKKIIYFLYSRSTTFLQQRLNRYNNRSDILGSYPYSVRIETYEAKMNKEPLLKAVWHYSIEFDYLPVFRLSKVLRLVEIVFDINPCRSSPCHVNQECHPLMNNKSKYICLCKSNFTGETCSVENTLCRNGYCAAQSLCKPDYSRLLQRNLLPYCICPESRYGERCDLVHDACQSSPCLNNGTCFPTSRPNQGYCLCTHRYYGSRCQREKYGVHLSLHENLQYAGAVVQYFDIDYALLDLSLVHQQVYNRLPSEIEYRHEQATAPEIILARLYSSPFDVQPSLYLLSVHLNTTSVVGTIILAETHRCLTVETHSNVTSVIQYHDICIKNHTLVCFRDAYYLCICNDNHTRVECFRYDASLDRCSHCRQSGLCLRGDRKQENSFLCLCFPCYSGRYCQFHSEIFTFTLDQLFFTDLTSNRKQMLVSLLVLTCCLAFILALPSNIFTFVTLLCRPCLRTGAGCYLLCMSMVNQMNLTLLAARLAHLTLSIGLSHNGSLTHDIICKLFSYSLTCCTRIAYWLACVIAMERIYVTLFLNAQRFKTPRVACHLITLICVIVLLSTAHELVFVHSFSSSDGKAATICVLEFPIHHRSIWTLIHQTSNIFNAGVPLVINGGCTITMICIIIKKKMNIYLPNRYLQKTKRQMMKAEPINKLHNKIQKDDHPYEVRNHLNVLRNVLNNHKETITRPIITLIPSVFHLFSLPFIIGSLSLACRNLETSQLRYLLIICYFIAFIPQTVTFFLYIYPSSFYYKHWQATNIGKRITALQSTMS